MKKKISFVGLKNLEQNGQGLLQQQVVSQRLLFGTNEIVEVSGNPWLALALETMRDPMIWFLLMIGTIFIFVGDHQEAIVLFTAIIPLAFMDAFLHWRTKASTSSLRAQLSATVRLIREGKEVLIDIKEIVPGDLILLSSGEYLPADGIFENTKDLQIDESILTGEAFSIIKRSGSEYLKYTQQRDDLIIESECLGFAGTRILTGEGRLRVLLTGQKTAYGEIIQSVENLPQDRTPLQKSISKLVQVLIIIAGFFCLLLAAVRIYQGYGWLDAILSAATLAVAAIPEEFPVVFTFFLGVGVYRLAKKRALVRRAVSVENIGRVTQICTDKTGTITIGQLKLTHFDSVAGVANDELLYAAACASDPVGIDPVDQAIIEAAQIKFLKLTTRLQVFPFTEDRRYEVAIIKDFGQYICYIKGAPETVLAKSELTTEEHQYWLAKTSKWAREGHKILACGQRELSIVEFNLQQEPDAGFKFLGLIAFEDPARPEVAGAIKYCSQHSIRVLMITGDHPETATAIAKDIGLGENFPKVISAETEFDKFTKNYLQSHPDFLRELDVVARCNPLQKLEIVQALRQAGELVAVTGDGVNDVPALKAADIAIAMGERGTRSAKEVSSIVLTDDNFQTIINAIIEGRQLFYNLKTSFEYLLLIHTPFVLTAAVIPLLGYPLLYLPVHIVWLELIIHPTALFAFQKQAGQQDLNKKHQRQITARFFTSIEALRIFIIGLIVTGVLMYIFISDHIVNLHAEYARSKALAVLMFWSAGIVAVKTGLKNRGAFFIFCASFLSVIVIIQAPYLADTLHVSALQLSDWFQSIAIVAVFIILLWII